MGMLWRSLIAVGWGGENASSSLAHPFVWSLAKSLRSAPSVRAELVESGACLFEKHAWVQGGGRESPGLRVTFFCFAKRKSPKKRRPPVCDPLALLRGDLRRGGCGVRRGTRYAPLALRSDNHGESVDDAGVSCGTRPHPLPCASRHAQKGVGKPGHPHGPSLRSARGECAGATAARCADGAKRSDGPCGCLVFGLPVPTPAGCACGVAVAG